MELVLASRNAHKLQEMRVMLGDHGVELIGLDRWPEIPDAPEDHDTFAANAIQKAQFVFDRVGLPTIADDSGIEIRALDWAPGVYSKRWTPEGTDAANNARLLAELAERVDRHAQYRCVIAMITDTDVRTVEGMCEGTIGHTPKGTGGFGYDPLFWPVDAPGRTMAELSMTEKNQISHRARAVAQLTQLLG